MTLASILVVDDDAADSKLTASLIYNVFAERLGTPTFEEDPGTFVGLSFSWTL